MEKEQWKIGEIYVFIDEDRQAPTNGSLGFIFNDKLMQELTKEGNEDLRANMQELVTNMHDIIVEIQKRGA